MVHEITLEFLFVLQPAFLKALDSLVRVVRKVLVSHGRLCLQLAELGLLEAYSQLHFVLRIALPLLERLVVYPVPQLQPHIALLHAVFYEPSTDHRLTLDHVELVELEVCERCVVEVVRVLAPEEIARPSAPNDASRCVLAQGLETSRATAPRLAQRGVPLTYNVGDYPPTISKVLTIEALNASDGLDEAELLDLPVLLHGRIVLV